MPDDAPRGRHRDDHGPSPEDVRREIEQLAALDDEEFRDALGDNVLQPDPVETAAFRSPALAVRSYRAARALNERTLEWIRELQTEGLVQHRSKHFQRVPREPGESDAQYRKRVENVARRRADHFRQMARGELLILEAIVQGLRAQHGVLPNAPNPRGRALRRLAQRHPQEFLAILREEQDIDRKKAVQRRKENKERNRRARRGGPR